MKKSLDKIKYSLSELKFVKSLPAVFNILYKKLVDIEATARIKKWKKIRHGINKIIDEISNKNVQKNNLYSYRRLSILIDGVEKIKKSLLKNIKSSRLSQNDKYLAISLLDRISLEIDINKKVFCSFEKL